MKYTLNDSQEREWQVQKIGVVGPGIVGMPMAALLANARICIGTDQPAEVVVVQRNSINSGWKVDAINSGRSVIGGIEPDLDAIVKDAVAAGLLRASWDYATLADVDVVLISIQTDKKGVEPDYGPLFGGLTDLAEALRNKPSGKVPLIIFESTLAPSSMATVISEHFRKYGLIEGRDILLGNSPNRVMPGRLVERVAQSDKLVAGLHPDTPKLISHLYRHIVTRGTLHQTNSMTAEVVKTLENAYRDVRIAFSTEVVRYCDSRDIDFYSLRDRVNDRLAQKDNASGDPNCVPSGGLLIPTVGVGGHCLPKDGILLWWRRKMAGQDTSHSLIFNSRSINDESPAETIRLLERSFGAVDNKRVAVLGTAYRFNSEDTRNSPSIQLALQLLERGCTVTLHDPYVKPDDQNLLKFKVDHLFTRDIGAAVNHAEFIIFATAHQVYIQQREAILQQAEKLKGVIDGCNLYKVDMFAESRIPYVGIGRGQQEPEPSLVDYVCRSFRAMESGLANEVLDTCSFLNQNYAQNAFNQIQFQDVRQLAASCSTGCDIAEAGQVDAMDPFQGFSSRLAVDAARARRQNP